CIGGVEGCFSVAPLNRPFMVCASVDNDDIEAGCLGMTNVVQPFEAEVNQSMSPIDAVPLHLAANSVAGLAFMKEAVELVQERFSDRHHANGVALRLARGSGFIGECDSSVFHRGI